MGSDQHYRRRTAIGNVDLTPFIQGNGTRGQLESPARLLPLPTDEREQLLEAKRVALSALRELAYYLAHDVGIEELHRPATVPEPATGVLLRTAGRLHDAIETHELTDNDSHGFLQSWVLEISHLGHAATDFFAGGSERAHRRWQDDPRVNAEVSAT